MIDSLTVRGNVSVVLREATDVSFWFLSPVKPAYLMEFTLRYGYQLGKYLLYRHPYLIIMLLHDS